MGLITQPLYIYSTFVPSKPAHSVGYSYTLTYSGFPLRETGFVFCQVSMLTTTAIRVDRLLALFTEIRYRKVATLTRAHVFIAFPWLFCVAVGLSSYFYTWRDYFVKLHYSFSMYGYLDLKHFSQASQSSCKSTVPAGEIGREKISNKCSTLQRDSVQCIVGPILNPLLYCWKMREVRQTVKTLTREYCCFTD